MLFNRNPLILRNVLPVLLSVCPRRPVADCRLFSGRFGFSPWAAGPDAVFLSGKEPPMVPFGASAVPACRYFNLDRLFCLGLFPTAAWSLLAYYVGKKIAVVNAPGHAT
jgi:hypothetical protein